MCFVVSAGDVMERSGIRRPGADHVDSGVDKADRWLTVGLRLLIDQRYKSCPERCGATGASDTGSRASVVGDNIDAIRNHGHIGNIPRECRSLIGCHVDSLLPNRNRVVDTDPAAARTIGLTRSGAGIPVPHGFRLPGSLWPGRRQGCPTNQRDVRAVCLLLVWPERGKRSIVPGSLEERLTLRCILFIDLIKSRVVAECPGTTNLFGQIIRGDLVQNVIIEC